MYVRHTRRSASFLSAMVAAAQPLSQGHLADGREVMGC